MQDFFSSVEIVKQNILAIRQASKRVSELNQEVLYMLRSARILHSYIMLGCACNDF